jgi:hypothetical protein
MHFLLEPTFILLLFVLVRALDIAIVSAYAQQTIRAICYGLVGILALVAVIIALVVH